MSLFKSVAIDGPAGAGKSDVSDVLAEKLGFVHVDTGALYRAVALYFSRIGLRRLNEECVYEELKNVSVEIEFLKNKQITILNGENVIDELRSENVSMMASKVSSLRCVREFLLSTQRDISNSRNVIMDGRDVSTVVLPDADVKIFLTASAEERARRRFKQMQEKGIRCTYSDVLDSIIIRDEFDSSRELCPLKPSKDAMIYDTTGKEMGTVVYDLLKYIKEVCFLNEDSKVDDTIGKDMGAVISDLLKYIMDVM